MYWPNRADHHILENTQMNLSRMKLICPKVSAGGVNYQKIDATLSKYEKFYVVVIAVADGSRGDNIVSITWEHGSSDRHRRRGDLRQHQSLGRNHHQDQGRSSPFSKQASARKQQSSCATLDRLAGSHSTVVRRCDSWRTVLREQAMEFVVMPAYTLESRRSEGECLEHEFAGYVSRLNTGARAAIRMLVMCCSGMLAKGSHFQCCACKHAEFALPCRAASSAHGDQTF